MSANMARARTVCVCARASVCLGMERRRAPREAPLSPNKNHRVGSNTHTQQRRRVSRWSQSASWRQQAGLIHVNSCFRCQFVCSRQSSLSDHQRGDLKRTHWIYLLSLQVITCKTLYSNKLSTCKNNLQFQTFSLLWSIFNNKDRFSI